MKWIRKGPRKNNFGWRGGAAPGWQGATTRNSKAILRRSNAARWDASVPKHRRYSFAGPKGGFLALALAAGLTASQTATAQEEGRVITLAEITIVGRVQKPVAAVDVSRLRPKLTLSELRHPFVYRIELVVRRDPF